jgi:hypothetical protein
VEALRSGPKIFVIGQWSFVIGHLEKSDPLLEGAEAEGFGVAVRGEVTHRGAARHPSQQGIRPPSELTTLAG